jgi:hypothetical protein
VRALELVEDREPHHEARDDRSKAHEEQSRCEALLQAFPYLYACSEHADLRWLESPNGGVGSLLVRPATSPSMIPISDERPEMSVRGRRLIFGLFLGKVGLNCRLDNIMPQNIGSFRQSRAKLSVS